LYDKSEQQGSLSIVRADNFHIFDGEFGDAIQTGHAGRIALLVGVSPHAGTMINTIAGQVAQLTLLSRLLP